MNPNRGEKQGFLRLDAKFYGKLDLKVPQKPFKSGLLFANLNETSEANADSFASEPIQVVEEQVEYELGSIQEEPMQELLENSD